MSTVVATQRVNPAQHVKDRRAVLASEVRAGAAARQGQVRVPAAAPLNPTFIGNVPSARYLQNGAAFHPGNLAA